MSKKDNKFSDNEIENILKSYKRLKVKVTCDQEKLMDQFPSCISIMGDGTSRPIGLTSDSTARYALKNATTREYLLSSVANVSKQVRTIELMYESLDSDCRELIKFCFMDRNGRQNTMEHLCITREMFGLRRRRAFDEINDMLTGISQTFRDFDI